MEYSALLGIFFQWGSVLPVKAMAKLVIIYLLGVSLVLTTFSFNLYMENCRYLDT